MPRYPHTLADLDPLRSSRPRPIQTLVRVDRSLRQAGSQAGALGFGEVQSGIYRGPLGRSRHLIETAKGDVIEVTGAQGSTTYTDGQVVTLGVTRDGYTILGSPPSGVVGASQFSRAEISGDVSLPRVHSVDPPTLPAGTTPVTFYGSGFLEEPVDVLSPIGEYVEDPPGFAPYPDASIGAVTWVSASEIQAGVTVSAPVGDGFGVRVDRG